MRLFVALALAEDVLLELAKVRQRLARRDDGLRWTAAESWHVTLQFLGETDAARMTQVVDALRTVRATPLTVSMEDLGIFERAGVLYAGVRATPELLTLEQCVVEATAQCGFVREARPFRPHITLARRKGRVGSEALGALERKLGTLQPRGQFMALEFCLYESYLGTGGSRY